MVISVVFIAIFANFIAPYNPIEQYRGFTKLPPVWIEGGDWRLPLGTDAVGRDMLSRIMYGARISLFIGLSVMIVSMPWLGIRAWPALPRSGAASSMSSSSASWI